MINRGELQDKLTEEFIQYQYRLDNPMPTPDESFSLMLRKYRDDIAFNHKVKNLVAGVMRIVGDVAKW